MMTSALLKKFDPSAEFTMIRMMAQINKHTIITAMAGHGLTTTNIPEKLLELSGVSHIERILQVFVS
jgi:pyridoxine 5'-phosphate synthase PdxJ